MKQLAIDYFSAFESKNLEKLEMMFSNDIVLIDWDINTSGKSNVISANKNIFNNIENLKITIVRIFVDSKTVIAELKIRVNDEISLNVVDILDFNQDNKIKKITAYKR